jgi:DNA (cytosine-5)-methyltransferase 1
MTCFLSLFSGIGGFDLAAHRAGLRFDGHYFSETDGYAAGLFQKRFPEAVPLGDVRSIDYGKLPEGEWVIAGGPPCQPFSVAGKRLRRKDTRNLWPETVRAIRGLGPAACLFENVTASLEYLDGEILPEIECQGYKTLPLCLSARTVGACHTRKRLWIVAYPDRLDVESRVGVCEDTREVSPGDTEKGFSPERWIQAVGSASRSNDGYAAGMAVRAAGNAVVPACAELIFMLPVFDGWRLGGLI